MPINSNIPLGVRSAQIGMPDPVAQFGKALQLKSLLMQQQQQEQTQADDEASRRAFASSGGDMAAYLKNLAASGNPRAYQAAQKAQGEFEKQAAEIGHLKSQTANQNATAAKSLQERDVKALDMYREALSGVNDPSQAAQWLAAGYQDQTLAPILGRFSTLEQAVSRIPSDPQEFRLWKAQQALGAQKFIEQNKPQYVTRNTGGMTETLALPGLGIGAPQTVSTIRNTQSPDSAASVAATIRGQNMTDARAREQMAQGKQQYDAERGVLVNTTTGQAVPVTQGGAPIGPKDKNLTDAQAKAALFGARMQAADKIMNDLAQQGKMFSTPGARAGFGVGSAVNVVNSAEAQKLDQAKRDFINAVLRRESGAVISDSEFDNAEKQYFPQVGDAPSVIQQKAANRALATRGILAEVPDGQRAKVLEQLNPRQESDQLPDPAKYNGATMTDQQTGQRYRSNGKSWVKQ